MFGNKSNSPAIKAEGLHYKLEGYISLAIAIAFLLSIALRIAGFDGKVDHYIDSIATIIASVTILIPSFHLAKEAFFKLLDSSIEEEGQMDIIKMLSVYSDKFCDFKDIKTRTSGRRHFVELKLVLPQDIPIAQGHKIISEIEKDIIKVVNDGFKKIIFDFSRTDYISSFGLRIVLSVAKKFYLKLKTTCSS